MLYAIQFSDRRDRQHVAAVEAATPEKAVRLLVAYQQEHEGFRYNIIPEVDDVVEIHPAKYEDKVQVLWHEDYD